MQTHAAEPTAERFIADVAQRFGADPVRVARAPGRVNLIGDHVDYCGGVVLPMAIPQRCFCAVLEDQHAGAEAIVSSAAFDEEIRFDTRRPLEPGGIAPIGSWGSYILGIAAGLAEHADLSRLAGCRIHVESNVPLGGGLSSSAALEVSVGTALAAYLGAEIRGMDMALLCQTAEHRFAGMPCGIMDQAVSAMAEEGAALKLDCATGNTMVVPMPTEARFLVFHSGVSHALADGAYEKRRAKCEASAEALGAEHLAHADESSVKKLDKELRPYARHVITETARVHAACKALDAGDLLEFGRQMSASHASLRDDFLVSCEEVDALVEAVESAEGCLGARMTGGGFGGCVVALVTPGSEDEVVAASEAARAKCPNLSLVEVYPAAGAKLIR